LKYFPVQVENIPIQLVENTHGPIGETVNDIKLNLFPGPCSRDQPPTFGTQINCKDLLGGLWHGRLSVEGMYQTCESVHGWSQVVE
jgi:hypothetical protein